MDEEEAYNLVENLGGGEEEDASPPDNVHVLLMTDPDDKPENSFEQENGVVGFDGEGYVIFNCGAQLEENPYWVLCQMTAEDSRPLCLTMSTEEESTLISEDIGNGVTGTFESDGLKWFHHGPFDLNGDSIRIHTDGFWPHVKQFVLIPSSSEAVANAGATREGGGGEVDPAAIMAVLQEPTNKSDNVEFSEEEGQIVVEGDEGFYEFEFMNEVFATEIYLDVTYSSEDSRPIVLFINEEEVDSDCCAEETGSYAPDDAKHVRCGPYPIEAEANTIKVTTNDGYFPHVGQIRVVDASKVEADVVTEA